MPFLEISENHIEYLSEPGTDQKSAHCFDSVQIAAVNAALGAGRPLLVRGEPGIGKSQLARAVASLLGWAWLPMAVDARSEARDLLWHFDAVARLGEAQIGTNKNKLGTENFLSPGALWWAFDWESAEAQAKLSQTPVPERPKQKNSKKDKSKQGRVVLIDEIDKAGQDVPNGLLQALGSGEFYVKDQQSTVCMDDAPRLIVITSNEERTLPSAFVRRCLVLNLSLSTSPTEAQEHFVRVGTAHFAKKLSEETIHHAANLTAKERARAHENGWRPLPGQAEYLDFLRSIAALAKGDQGREKEVADQMSMFFLAKDPSSQPAG